MGENEPCVGELWRTADGGRSWRPTGTYGGRLAVAGPGDIWLASGTMGRSDVLWHSLDGGRSWSPVANPDSIALSALLAAGERLWVSTEAGQFMSDDGGLAWHSPPAATVTAEGQIGGPVSEVGDSGLVVVQTGLDEIRVSDDGGRSGRSETIAGLGQSGTSVVAFANDSDALALSYGSCAVTKPLKRVLLPLRPSTVVATNDGGAAWHKVASVDVWGYGGLAYSDALALVAGTCSNGTATSTDGGATWAYWGLPAGLSNCQQPSLAGRSASLFCTSTSADGVTVARALVSEDAGQHWYSYRLSGPAAQDVAGVVAAGPEDLWAYGQTAGEVWHSTDGGTSWRVARLALPVAP